MNNRDPHQSLKSEVMKQGHSRNANIALARLQWGKDDIGYSLHVEPNSFSSAGIQITDFLGYLGFQRSNCLFINSRQCYVRWADEKYDIDSFGLLLDQSFSNLVEAQRELGECGFFIDQPEGWGFYFGKSSQGRIFGKEYVMQGDGHTAAHSETMKNCEDENFRYVFTWLKNSERDKGWIIHYLPKHIPLSSEIRSAFAFLKIESFNQCPQNDFEPCNWKSIKYITKDDPFHDSNAEIAHRWFEAHEKHFSSGIHKLLTANSDIEKASFKFLPFSSPQMRLEEDIKKRIIRPKSAALEKIPSSYDVAISFAGTERVYAEKMANLLKQEGFSVFYDDFYPEYLWGKNLIDTFDEIYRKRARYCVIFVSKEYNESNWTNHERQSAQARAFEEKGKEYILQIKVDDTELAGMPPTFGYVQLSKGIENITGILIKKLEGK